MSYMRKTVEVPAYHEMMQELFQAIKELGGRERYKRLMIKRLKY